MNSLFITFEGIDGSGKSTHLRRAEEWMAARGLPVRRTKEPGGTALGDAIRGLFLDHRWAPMDGRIEALLVFASRLQHLEEVIEPALAGGEHVLCDRFTDSTVVYQGVGRGLPGSWIDRLDELTTGRRQPDSTLLFDLDPKIAHQRGQAPTRGRRPEGIDRIDVESLEFYSRVREGYLELAERAGGRVRMIDSSGSAEETWAQVESALRELLRI